MFVSLCKEVPHLHKSESDVTEKWEGIIVHGSLIPAIYHTVLTNTYGKLLHKE